MFFRHRRPVEPLGPRRPFEALEGAEALYSPLPATDLLHVGEATPEIPVSLYMARADDDREISALPGTGRAFDPRQLDQLQLRRERRERERGDVRPVMDFGMPTTGSEWIGGGDW